MAAPMSPDKLCAIFIKFVILAVCIASSAASNNCVKAILFLDILKSRLNVNAKNDMGDTPLHLAAKWGYDGIVNFLLESEADPRYRNRKRQTPFDLAQNPDIRKSLQQILDDPPPMIVRYPISPDSSQPASNPAPSTSIAHDDDVPDAPPTSVSNPPTNKPRTPSISMPANTPSSPSTKSPLGFEVLDVKPRAPIPMIDNSSSAMMSPVKPAVASLDKVDSRQIDKLFKAIAAKDTPLVCFHLGWTETPDTPTSPQTPKGDNQLCHPLCMCDKCQNIQKHSNMNSLPINCQNKKGFAPLHIAVIEKNAEVFELLLDKGAFVNIQNNQNITPLHLACFHNVPEFAHRLIQCGAKINCQDQHGEIPLHLACAKSNLEIATTLIQHSSSINVGNVDGYRPLHHAVTTGNIPIIQLLLDNGAIPDVVNCRNKTPQHFTRNIEIHAMLKSKLDEMNKSTVSSGEKVSDEAPDKLDQLASDLEEQDVQSLRQLGLSIKSFDKQGSLKRSKTFDHSKPDVDNPDLKLALAIKHFDKDSGLRRSKTLDHSKPVLDSPELALGLSIRSFDKSHSLKKVSTKDRSQELLGSLKLPLSIQHFETGSLKHVEPVDKSSPLHIYSLTRRFSCYENYNDTPVTDDPKAIDTGSKEVIEQIDNVSEVDELIKDPEEVEEVDDDDVAIVSKSEIPTEDFVNCDEIDDNPDDIIKNPRGINEGVLDDSGSNNEKLNKPHESTEDSELVKTDEKVNDKVNCDKDYDMCDEVMDTIGEHGTEETDDVETVGNIDSSKALYENTTDPDKSLPGIDETEYVEN